MNYDDKLDAVMQIWRNKVREDLHRPDYVAFAKFIGWPPNENNRYVVNILKPEIQQIIDTLHGPHTKALLKVMEIRNKEKANAR